MNDIVNVPAKSSKGRRKKDTAVAASAAPTNSPPKSYLRTDYLIQARWTSATFIRQVFDSIKDLINETNMDWDKSGIKIQGMDSAHVALSNIFLSSSDCECYHVSESITVGIDLPRLSKILATADSTDSCEFFIQSDQDNSLSILIEAKDGSKRTLFEIPLMEIDMEFMNIPENKYNYSVRISANDIPTTIRDLSFLGDVAELVVTPREFSVKVSSQTGKGHRSWKVGEEPGYCAISADGKKLALKFSIRYLLLAMKAACTTQTMILEMNDGSPLRIRCLFGDNSSIINFVAPKIEDEDGGGDDYESE